MMAAIVKRIPLLLHRNFCLACAKISCHTDVKYPDIKPKYPKGSWYSFSPTDAWKWYEDVEAIDKLDTINKRLYYNYGSKNQLYYFDVKPYLNTPNVLGFQEEITKSCLNSQAQARHVEISSDRWLSIVSDIKAVVSDGYNCFKRQAKQSATEEEWEVKKRRYVLGSVLNRLLVLLTSDAPQLLNYDLDSNVNVQTHWARGGERTPSNAFTQILPKSGVLRYGYWQNVDFQLRNNLPLSTEHIGDVGVFAQPLDPQPPSEALHTYHEAFESHREQLNHNLGDLNPHIRALQKKCYSLPHEPGFKYGAPGEFVNLSVLSPWLSDVHLKDKLTDVAYFKCMMGAGLVNSFTTSHALAHYQGYDMHHDLISPLLTQTIVTDGVKFMCITHQLNTLRLFVHDIDNDRYNGYSHSELVDLYHTIDNDGTMIGFNPECVQMIGQCILAKCTPTVPVNPYFEKEQVKSPSSGDLLPYLPTYRHFEDIPELDPESVAIPTFIRYTRSDDPLSEWDLPRDKRLLRVAEKKTEHELTKGPLHDSHEPPARGMAILDSHFEKERMITRQKRIKWRDQIIEYKRRQAKKGGIDMVKEK